MRGEPSIQRGQRIGLILAIGVLVLPLFGQGQPGLPAGDPAPDPLPPAKPGALPDEDRSAVIIQLHGMVNDVMHERLKRQLEEAEAAGADEIVLEMDTWGGLATSALEMSDSIKNCTIPTTAWVNPKAISAGAMISVACDRIIVATRARIGDCMPIAGGGQAMDDAQREKIETVVREEFRDSAKRNGYSLTLCSAMVTRGEAVYAIQHNDKAAVRYVYASELAGYGLNAPQPGEVAERENPPQQDPPADQQQGAEQGAKRIADRIRDVLVPADAEKQGEQPDDKPQPAVPAAIGAEPPFDPGQWSITKRVLAEGQLLTISQDEAIEYGFAAEIVPDDVALAKFLNVTTDSIVRYEANWSEHLVGFLTHPAVQGLLTILLLMGLYSEMQSPGLGLAGGVALGAGLVLLGAPYLTGLANNVEILLILAGIALLAVEVFVIPGFGIAGISGIILMFVGLLFAFVPSDPGPGWVPTLPGTWDALEERALTLLASLAISIVGMAILTRYFGALPVFNRLILTDAQAAAASKDAVSAGVGGTGGVAAAIAVGDTGTALGDLRPAGSAEIGNARVDVTSASGWIANGDAVRVVEVTGNRVVVEGA